MDELLSMRRMFHEGMLQADIAKAVGMSVSRVSRILRGLAYPEAHKKLGLEGLTLKRKAGPGRGHRKVLTPSGSFGAESQKGGIGGVG